MTNQNKVVLGYIEDHTPESAASAAGSLSCTAGIGTVILQAGNTASSILEVRYVLESTYTLISCVLLGEHGFSIYLSVGI